MDEAVTLYKQANEVLGNLANEQILKHERIQDGVVRITYTGGTSILVNYNADALNVDGTTVGGTDYVVEGVSR